MQVLVDIGILLAAYIFGSVPFGLILVKLVTGKDLRHIESGRTGGTNAMRAAGFLTGFLTALFDILKSAAGVWAARAVTENVWIHALAPVAVILGHNYSIFLAERTAKGGWRLRGGAGGAPSVGGAFGLWWPSIFIIIPLGFVVWFGMGYASVATMSVAVIAIVVFTVRAFLGISPWVYAIYGVLAEILLVVALLPNIKRLRLGTERRHGLPEMIKKQKGLRQVNGETNGNGGSEQAATR
jgi:acyl phosphate:glycerol-3-phosphate acyltransferase